MHKQVTVGRTFDSCQRVCHGGGYCAVTTRDNTKQADHLPALLVPCNLGEYSLEASTPERARNNLVVYAGDQGEHRSPGSHDPGLFVCAEPCRGWPIFGVLFVIGY